jgi:hypothetical protein
MQNVSKEFYYEITPNIDHRITKRIRSGQLLGQSAPVYTRYTSE